GAGGGLIEVLWYIGTGHSRTHTLSTALLLQIFSQWYILLLYAFYRQFSYFFFVFWFHVGIIFYAIGPFVKFSGLGIEIQFFGIFWSHDRHQFEGFSLQIEQRYI